MCFALDFFNNYAMVKHMAKEIDPYLFHVFYGSLMIAIHLSTTDMVDQVWDTVMDLCAACHSSINHNEHDPILASHSVVIIPSIL